MKYGKELIILFASIIMIALATWLMLIRVNINYKNYTTGYKLNELRRTYENVLSENYKLKLIYSTLTDTSRIIEIARHKLKLFQSLPEEIEKIKIEEKQ